jgi:hypothetical protein
MANLISLVQRPDNFDGVRLGGADTKHSASANQEKFQAFGLGRLLTNRANRENRT